ncbi:MAG: DUF427 domain-containing protein [Anaerolineae bacterium]
MTQADDTQRVVDEMFIPDHRVEVEPSPRRVRVVFGGETIADSTQVLLLRESGRLPVYYFPQGDVRMDLLEATDHRLHSPHKGDAVYWTVRVGDRVAENVVWGYPDPAPGGPDLRGYVAFEWDKMDAWFEEDEEVYVHPRDPYKRVDALRSSRHVRVVVGGETVADSRRPVLLFETGLPTRYYIPKNDVRMDLLVPSETRSQCPYKGRASYYSVKVGDRVFEDLVWYYPFPIPECPRIENLLCFFNEKVEALYVDGELQPKPQTPWS